LLSSINVQVETMRMNSFLMKKNVQIHKEKIAAIQDELETLKQMPTTQVTGGNFDPKLLAGFASEQSLKDLERKLKALEESDGKQNTTLGSHATRLAKLEEQYASLYTSL